MATLLINGEQTFLDSNGSPLGGGSVYFYIPNTTTFKNTWQDPGATILNTNPVVLDSAGRAIIYGIGAYRQIVKDSLGNTIWDQQTADVSGNLPSGSALPTGPQAYEEFVDISRAPSTLKIYDGSQWVPVGSLDTTNHVWTSANCPYGVPGLRLTLTSGAPVMGADVTGATILYYSPYAHSLAPIYNGVLWAVYNTGGEISCVLNSSQQLTGEVHDVFLFLNAGTPIVGVGPSWAVGGGSQGARGTGAGSTALTRLNGYEVNAYAITLYNGATSYAVGANQAFYIGTLWASGNGQVSMQFRPAPAAGGTNNALGLWNAYNQVETQAICADSTASWTYASTTWRQTDGNNSNRINFVSGLPQSQIRSVIWAVGANGGVSAGQIGCILDSTTGAPASVGHVSYPGASNAFQFASAEDLFVPQTGLHYLQGMERVDQSSTETWNGGNSTGGTSQLQGMKISLRM